MLYALLCFLLPIRLFCQDIPAGPELIRSVMRRPDLRAHGTMVFTGRNKGQKVYQLTVLRKRMAQSAVTLCYYTWPRHGALRHEACGAHDCTVVRSEPAADTPTAYAAGYLFGVSGYLGEWAKLWAGSGRSLQGITSY